MLGVTPAICTRVSEGESELRVSIGDEGVVLPSVLSFTTTNYNSGRTSFGVPRHWLDIGLTDWVIGNWK
jgi:hypothetical protein